MMFMTGTTALVNLTHIPREDLAILEGQDKLPILVGRDPGSFVVAVERDWTAAALGAVFSAPFVDLLMSTQQQGCCWVRFDEEAPTYPELPTYGRWGRGY